MRSASSAMASPGSASATSSASGSASGSASASSSGGDALLLRGLSLLSRTGILFSATPRPCEMKVEPEVLASTCMLGPAGSSPPGHAPRLQESEGRLRLMCTISGASLFFGFFFSGFFSTTAGLGFSTTAGFSGSFAASGGTSSSSSSTSSGSGGGSSFSFFLLTFFSSAAFSKGSSLAAATFSISLGSLFFFSFFSFFSLPSLTAFTFGWAARALAIAVGSKASSSASSWYFTENW
mmetsp:Transcript_29265/g.86882  ORF Transcript_29265/g.86882 Transcript_29265/m.86882 type:complete len:237 (-) Transcript_29265:1194-1904(-)